MSYREGLMSPRIETKASVGFKAGVEDYKLTYYTPKYETKDTDTLAAFQVTPQSGVPPEKAGAAATVESSTTWTTVWIDGLTTVDPLRTLRLEDLRIPIASIKIFQGLPYDIQVERDKLNHYGRPLLRCTIKSKLGFSAKNYGRAVYECLRGGLDFTKDDESELPTIYALARPFPISGIHIWHMLALTEIFGDDSSLQFGGGTLAHLWGNAPSVIANQVALEACVQAHNEGRDLAREGSEIICEASKWSPELAAACKDIPIEFHSKEKPYEDHIDSYQRETGLTEAVQTGIGQLNGIPIAIGLWIFSLWEAAWDP
ncbi:hypothetical protein Syun_021281 [Stephania yunnanensis]|uniref:Ribulose bisphosphate carboxylase large chain n=1 Tax=Stephania yunnanensis TaxID=152371 RepID=A0AAP0IFD3_9MAGN